jgi:hypothetical protein
LRVDSQYSKPRPISSCALVGPDLASMPDTIGFLTYARSLLFQPPPPRLHAVVKPPYSCSTPPSNPAALYNHEHARSDQRCLQCAILFFGPRFSAKRIYHRQAGLGTRSRTRERDPSGKLVRVQDCFSGHSTKGPESRRPSGTVSASAVEEHAVNWSFGE